MKRRYLDILDKDSLKRAKRFNISSLKLGHRICIFGATGSGKSWFGSYLYDKYSRYQLSVILDTKREFYRVPELIPDFMDIDYKNNKYVHNTGLYKITEIQELSEIGKKPNDFIEILKFISNNLFNHYNSCLIAEECGYYIKKAGYTNSNHPEFFQYLTQGRKRNCTLICTSQRPATIHTDIPSQSEHLFIFRMYYKTDLEYLSEYLDPSYLQRLKPYQFFHFNMKEGYISRCLALNTARQVYGLKYLGKDKEIALKER